MFLPLEFVFVDITFICCMPIKASFGLDAVTVLHHDQRRRDLMEVGEELLANFVIVGYLKY